MKKIKILGSGCPKCQTLEKITRETAESMGIEFEIEKVKELSDIMSYGVMMTPGLVVDEKVKFAGKLPTADEIKSALSEAS